MFEIKDFQTDEGDSDSGNKFKLELEPPVDNKTNNQSRWRKITWFKPLTFVSLFMPLMSNVIE